MSIIEFPHLEPLGAWCKIGLVKTAQFIGQDKDYITY